MSNYRFSHGYTTYDSYKWIRKNKWLNLNNPITEKDYYAIIRTVNKHIVNSFLDGNTIKLPNGMGKLILSKRKTRVQIIDNKIKTDRPVNWKETLKLWEEDEYSRVNKKLVWLPVKSVYRVKYDKTKSKYTNKIFIDFYTNRSFKKKLKESIDNGLDAFEEIKYGD